MLYQKINFSDFLKTIADGDQNDKVAYISNNLLPVGEVQVHRRVQHCGSSAWSYIMWCYIHLIWQIFLFNQQNWYCCDPW